MNNGEFEQRFLEFLEEVESLTIGGNNSLIIIIKKYKIL
jgi:hypothetical protein